MRPALAAVLIALLTGCAHDIGGRPFPLTIDTPGTKGATAYLILNTEWVAHGMDKLGTDDQKFRDFVLRYKVTEGKTPVTTYAPSYQYVVVVSINGKFQVARDTVVPGEVNHVEVTIDGAP
jgi:hypothetical protein